jgi:hypothetical protein
VFNGFTLQLFDSFVYLAAADLKTGERRADWLLLSLLLMLLTDLAGDMSGDMLSSRHRMSSLQQHYTSKRE